MRAPLGTDALTLVKYPGPESRSPKRKEGIKVGSVHEPSQCACPSERRKGAGKLDAKSFTQSVMAQSYCTNTRPWGGSLAAQTPDVTCGGGGSRVSLRYSPASKEKLCPDSRAATPEGQYQPRQSNRACFGTDSKALLQSCPHPLHCHRQNPQPPALCLT